MNNFFRAIIAGYGAKKLGGGCFGTIVVFILIWVALGQCSFSSREIPPPQTYPAKYRVSVPLKLEESGPAVATLSMPPYGYTQSVAGPAHDVVLLFSPPV